MCSHSHLFVKHFVHESTLLIQKKTRAPLLIGWVQQDRQAASTSFAETSYSKKTNKLHITETEVRIVLLFKHFVFQQTRAKCAINSQNNVQKTVPAAQILLPRDSLISLDSFASFSGKSACPRLGQNGNHQISRAKANNPKDRYVPRAWSFIGPNSRAPTSGGQKTRVFGHTPDAVVSRWPHPSFWLAGRLIRQAPKKLQLLGHFAFLGQFFVCSLLFLPHFQPLCPEQHSFQQMPFFSLPLEIP